MEGPLAGGGRAGRRGISKRLRPPAARIPARPLRWGWCCTNSRKYTQPWINSNRRASAERTASCRPASRDLGEPRQADETRRRLPTVAQACRGAGTGLPQLWATAARSPAMPAPMATKDQNQRSESKLALGKGADAMTAAPDSASRSSPWPGTTTLVLATKHVAPNTMQPTQLSLLSVLNMVL